MTQVSANVSATENKIKTATNENVNEEKTDSEKLLPNTTIITHCIVTNDYNRLKRCFEDAADPYKDQINELMNKRDNSGKSPLDLIASLGISEMARILLQAGADIHNFTSKGYSCLHHAASWGQLEVLQLLVEHGGSLQQTNFKGETPRALAVRYGQTECSDFLETTEEKQKLQAEVSNSLARIQEIDKSLAGRITRDEKNLVINTCKGKQEWLNNNTNAGAMDLRSQHSELAELVQPILAKLSEPCT